MPVSPYLTQTSYALRPYPRSNASNITSSSPSSYTTSKYSGINTSTTSTYTGYKPGGYGKSKLPVTDEIPTLKTTNYLVGRYKSSDNIPESQTLLELKLKKSNSNSALLAGNTAYILKNFSSSDDKSRVCNYRPPKPRVEERKYCGKSGGTSIFANQYLAKVNRGRDFRPKEIDTRDINLTVKPRITPGFENSEESIALTRHSRHVVRLTIKRLEAEDPFVVKDKTIKTIAQRLIEKYTDKEKKPDTYEYVPRKRLYEDTSDCKTDSKDAASIAITPSASQTNISSSEDAPPSLPIATPAVASDIVENESPTEKPLPTAQQRKKSLIELRATMSPQTSFDDEGDAASRLLRATTMAANKKELENAEEVKDAIIAAVLHPDVDIESDEEMKELVHGNTAPSTLMKEENIRKEDDCSGDHSDEGKTIVGQLKRFVKKQVSTKGQTKKKKSSGRKRTSESKKSRKDSEIVGVSPFTDEATATKASSSSSPKKKISLKDDSSVLSADLIFGTNKSSKQKKLKDKTTNASDGQAKLEQKDEEKSQPKKIDRKSGLSLLSPSLVYNNLTSDEENESCSRPPILTQILDDNTKSSIEISDKNLKETQNNTENLKTKDNGEKAVSKIPKLKKKVKKDLVEEDGEMAKEFQPEIKVSSVESSSDTHLERPPAPEEKVPDFKEARESDTLRGINKKISSKTSTTGKDIETSDHQPSSTSHTGPKNSIPVKEIKSVRPEKSLPDDKKEKLFGEKSQSDVSAELKASKKSKDENAVKPKVSGKNEGAPDGGEASPLLITRDEVKDNESNEVKVRSSFSGKALLNDSCRDCKDNPGVIKKKISHKKSSINALKIDDFGQKLSINETCSETKEQTSSRDEKPICIEVGSKTEEVREEKEDGDKLENKEDKQCEVPNDAILGKKAAKRPRQVGPPPPQENAISNLELLNARKILKRPVKKVAGAAPVVEENLEQPTTPEDPNKKLWKRPIAQLVPPKDGDQFLQARNVLKKPVKTKIPVEDNNEKPTGKLPELKGFKKLRKPVVAGAQQAKEGSETDGQKQRSRSPSSSDEEGEGGTKKADRQKRPPKPRMSKDKKKTPSPSGTTKEQGSGKDPKLSACQSADSGYGSSPSTPQPTQTMATDVKCEEEICTVCGTSCHKKCEKQMANLCGVNQKLLAEALSSVKKAGSADGTSRTLASPTKSSSVSASESETTEDESETDTDNDYFGLPEIRPPLQTRPKFKKYTINDFSFVKVLGKGSYGKVMLAQQKDTENYFAVKCLKKDVVLEDNDVECTLIERKVLSLGTKHPYLCHLFCTFQTPSHLFFVMEYLTGGDLMFHIQHCGRFDEFRACFYAAEITSGLKFLHSKGIIYRDLKLDNILLDYQGHIRIADFGMCKLQVYLDRYADTFCGTPDYMAPEVIKGQHYNQCVDWWSFGVLLYEMLTGKSPFKGCDEDHLFWLICNDEPFFPKFLSLEATEILKGLLDKDSDRRLGIPFSPYGEIKEHAFFKYIDWCKIERKEVETPYKPRLRHILDVQYFDRLFTKRQAAITPLDESILATMDQTAFTDFSYTNPNITD